MHTCDKCGDSFETQRGLSIHESRSHGGPEYVEKPCGGCGETVKRLASQTNAETIFCDQKCRSEWLKGKTLDGEEGHDTKSVFVCEFCGDEFERYSTSNSCKYCSKECFGKANSGKNHPNRVGRSEYECARCGDTVVRRECDVNGDNVYCSQECYHGPQSNSERVSKKQEIRKWRTKVFERDDYTCQDCGKGGGNLNAHHIERWSEAPELRFDVDNGVSLCVECHAQRHKDRGEENIATLILS